MPRIGKPSVTDIVTYRSRGKFRGHYKRGKHSRPAQQAQCRSPVPLRVSKQAKLEVCVGTRRYGSAMTWRDQAEWRPQQAVELRSGMRFVLSDGLREGCWAVAESAGCGASGGC